MLDSLIARKHLLGLLFGNTQYLCEVYADVDFDIANERPNLYCLTQHKIDNVFLYYKLCSIYTRGVNLHTTTVSTDIMLYDKKLLWRKGVWYV